MRELKSLQRIASTLSTNPVEHKQTKPSLLERARGRHGWIQNPWPDTVPFRTGSLEAGSCYSTDWRNEYFRKTRASCGIIDLAGSLKDALRQPRQPLSTVSKAKRGSRVSPTPGL